MHNLMQGLGQLLQIDLREDFNQSCTLNMDGIKVQMELDSPGEFLLLMTFISELPPGQFRETVLKEALKVNYTVEQKIGTLSYIKKRKCLSSLPHHPSSCPYSRGPVGATPPIL